jgi:predicted flap endonuclease-1-like 5' DNA nuclease
MHDKEDAKESFIQYEIKKYVNIRNPSDNEKIKYIQTIDKMKNNSFESKKENIETFKETIAPTKEVELEAAKEEINKPVETLPESPEEETSKDEISKDDSTKQLEEIKLISTETEFQFNDDGLFSFTL